MIILRGSLLLLLVLPAQAQSTTAKNQAVFTAGQLEKRCATHFARFERFESTNRLLEPSGSGQPNWVKISMDLRHELSQALGRYLAALDAGWKADDAELKQVRATLEQFHGRMEKCGVWTCFRWDEPRLSDGARDSLDKIRAKAWEGTLLVQAGKLDEGAQALQFARKLIQEIARDLDKALDEGRQVDDYREHPAHARTVAEVDRLEASVKGELGRLQETRAQLVKDTEALAGVVEECRPAMRGLQGLRGQSGTEDRIVGGIEALLGQLDAFERDLRPKATATLKSFADRYGADRDAISESIRRIMGRQGLQVPHSPQSLFDSLTRDLQQVEDAKQDAVTQLLEIASRNAATKAVDPARREQSFAMARRSLALALKLAPDHAEALKLQSGLGAGAAAAEKEADARLDAGTWEPHSARFQGPGAAEELAASALAWLSGDEGWTKKKDPLAVRVNGDWRVAERNIHGDPITWGLPIEAAFVRHEDRDADRDVAWVYSLTIVTREAEKAPPWKATWVGSNRQMQASKIRAAAGAAAEGAAPGTLPRLLLVVALLCSGLLLAGPFLTTKVGALAPVVGMLKPLRAVIGVATLALGAVFLLVNLFSLAPLADLLPQAAAIVAGLFLGLELLLRKPAALATPEGETVAKKAGEKVDAAVAKTQEFLASHQESVRKIGTYQVPLGIACLVLALLHLLAAGATFL
ncbi:MAG: hypothetical protein ACYTEZ_16760 [Planctomycetota bacterium]|jgi:hypothetical protein